MWRCEDVDLQRGCEDVDLQVWGCEDVDQQMWGCENVDQQMWGCEDVDQQMWRCEDADQQMWGCEDVDQQMWRCEDVDQQMWGREDVLQRLLFYEQPSQALSGKISAGCRIKICTALHRLVCCSIVGIYHHKCLWAINLYMSKYTYVYIYICACWFTVISQTTTFELYSVFSCIGLKRLPSVYPIFKSTVPLHRQSYWLYGFAACIYVIACVYISIHTQTF